MVSCMCCMWIPSLVLSFFGICNRIPGQSGAWERASSFPSDSNIHLYHVCTVLVDLAPLDPDTTSIMLDLDQKRLPLPLPHELLGLDGAQLATSFVGKQSDGGSEDDLEVKYKHQREMVVMAWLRRSQALARARENAVSIHFESY